MGMIVRGVVQDEVQHNRVDTLGAYGSKQVGDTWRPQSDSATAARGQTNKRKGERGSDRVT